MKRKIRDWTIILGMSSFGTIMAFLSWITRPEQIEAIKRLMRM